jgi:hypothetical protein
MPLEPADRRSAFSELPGQPLPFSISAKSLFALETFSILEYLNK